MTDTTEDFFAQPREHSQVKARIVSKYVHGWARILTDYLRSKGLSPQVAYIDLFSGPGSYDDGTASTPVLILKKIINDEKLSPAVMTYFNDQSISNCESLTDEVGQLPGHDKLRYKPSITNKDATVETCKALRIPTSIPKLYFLDPFGYKSLSIPLLSYALADWSECVFFFNYRRVIAALMNPVMKTNMTALFGGAGLNQLTMQILSSSAPLDNEDVVLSHLKQALKKMGAKYVHSFAFKVAERQRSTHHLVFATKHPKGSDLMKSVMAGESSVNSLGVADMMFMQQPPNLSLFVTDPLDELTKELLEAFSGQELTFGELYLKHGGKTNFVSANYRKVLLRLESEGRIQVAPSADARPANTMAKATKIKFFKAIQ